METPTNKGVEGGTKEYAVTAPWFISHARLTGTCDAERRRAVLTTTKSGVHSHGHADACGTYLRKQKQYLLY